MKRSISEIGYFTMQDPVYSQWCKYFPLQSQIMSLVSWPTAHLSIFLGAFLNPSCHLVPISIFVLHIPVFECDQWNYIFHLQSSYLKNVYLLLSVHLVVCLITSYHKHFSGTWILLMLLPIYTIKIYTLWLYLKFFLQQHIHSWNYNNLSLIFILLLYFIASVIKEWDLLQKVFISNNFWSDGIISILML